MQIYANGLERIAPAHCNFMTASDVERSSAAWLLTSRFEYPQSAGEWTFGPDRFLYKSSRLCENSPPHRRSATLIRARPADRNNDFLAGSRTHRYCASQTRNRVFTQSARYLYQPRPLIRLGFSDADFQCKMQAGFTVIRPIAKAWTLGASAYQGRMQKGVPGGVPRCAERWAPILFAAATASYT